MHEKEMKLKEEATTLAIKKGLMGLSGKFACIAKFLGSEIISETSEFVSESYLEDPWQFQEEEYDPTRVHTADEDSIYRPMGYIFCGLSRGMHLEIKYIIDESSIEVSYKGVRVYKEVTGDLDAYAPHAEWEDKIDQLYKLAKTIAERVKKETKEQDKIEMQRKFGKYMEHLRLRWGLW